MKILGPTMKTVKAVALVIWALGLLYLSGCTQAYTAKTKATWTTPDGKQISYESDKEQVGLDAEFDPATGKFHVKVDKASTNEVAIQAALAQSQALAKIMEAVLPVLLIIS